MWGWLRSLKALEFEKWGARAKQPYRSLRLWPHIVSEIVEIPSIVFEDISSAIVITELFPYSGIFTNLPQIVYNCADGSEY